MAFARWDPIRDLLAIQQRLDRSAPGPAGWRPPVDLHETADEYVITAELPGIPADQVELTCQDGMLRISGEKKEEREENERGYRLSERSYGSFERRIELPPGADEDKISAAYKDGVLTITIPKGGLTGGVDVQLTDAFSAIPMPLRTATSFRCA